MKTKKKVPILKIATLLIGLIILILLMIPKPLSEDEQKLKELLTGEEVGIKVGNSAPDTLLYNLNTAEGEMLSDHLGKTIILNFWGTWCAPCKEEMPDLASIYNEYKDEVSVIAVNMTETEKNELQALDFQKEYDLPFDVYQDVNGMVSSMFQIKPIPTTFIINEKGVITSSYKHLVTKEELEKAIQFSKYTNQLIE